MNLLINALLILDECESVLGKEVIELLQDLFTAIKIAVPLLVILLITVDMAKAVLASNEDQMKKAQKNAIVRLVVGAALFLLPIIVDLILDMSGLYGTCGIG